MELICPSCEARYGIPDGSIGEKGRQVSCMNCGHGWHAFPPLVLGAAQAAGSPSAGMQWRDPAGGASAPAWEDNEPPVSARADAAPASSGFAAAAGSLTAASGEASTSASDRSSASRSEQLLEIRETLAEIQSEDRVAATKLPPALDDAPTLNDFRRSGTERDELNTRSDGSDVDGRDRTRVYADGSDVAGNVDLDASDEEVDLLRRRMEQSSERAQPKPADVRRLRKTHDRRVKRQRSSSNAGSGAFLTGFLLVAIIASIMISLYLLAPQIVERVPGAEQPMNEYVSTVDGLRVSIAETYQGIAGWVSESLAGKV